MHPALLADGEVEFRGARCRGGWPPPALLSGQESLPDRPTAKRVQLQLHQGSLRYAPDLRRDERRISW